MASDGASASGRFGDRMDRLALASARIPFRLKVGVVWAGIFAVLAVFFWLCKFDTQWMRDEFGFIFGGLKFTVFVML